MTQHFPGVRLAAVATLLGLTMFSAGCATGPKPDLATHRVLLTDPEPQLAPLLLIGVEKYAAAGTGRVHYRSSLTPRSGRGSECVDGDSRCIDLTRLDWKGLDEKRATWLRKNLLSRVDDGSQMVVTHVVRLGGDTSAAEHRCFSIHSAYPPARDAPRSSPDKHGDPCLTTPASVPSGPQVEASWTALDKKFSDELSKEIDRSHPTHVIVMATGWKFSQERSLQAFREWMSGISAGLGPASSVRPLYVGVTWPARRGGPVQNLFFLNKAHDSDEVGLVWANDLVNRVLASKKKDKGVKVVLLGHSFGSRLLSRATFSWPALEAQCSEDSSPDLLIGLQAAFATSRFQNNTAHEPAVFDAYNTCGVRSVYTTSRNDHAVTLAPSQKFSRTSAYMGTYTAYKLAGDSDLFARTEWALNGDIVLPALGRAGAPGKNRVLMIDGTNHITEHNDVFDADAGLLVAKLIQAYAPSPPR